MSAALALMLSVSAAQADPYDGQVYDGQVAFTPVAASARPAPAEDLTAVFNAASASDREALRERLEGEIAALEQQLAAQVAALSAARGASDMARAADATAATSEALRTVRERLTHLLYLQSADDLVEPTEPEPRAVATSARAASAPPTSWIRNAPPPTSVPPRGTSLEVRASVAAAPLAFPTSPEPETLTFEGDGEPVPVTSVEDSTVAALMQPRDDGPAAATDPREADATVPADLPSDLPTPPPTARSAPGPTQRAAPATPWSSRARRGVAGMLAVLGAATLALWGAPRTVRHATAQLEDHPATSLARGLAWTLALSAAGLAPHPLARALSVALALLTLALLAPVGLAALMQTVATRLPGPSAARRRLAALAVAGALAVILATHGLLALAAAPVVLGAGIAGWMDRRARA